MKKKVVFDSNILISLANNEIDTARFIEMFRKKRKYVSLITQIEILSGPDISAEERYFLAGFLSECTIVPIRRNIIAETIRFRQTRRRKLPDSIIAATAVILNAVLISNDSHLLQVKYPALSVESFELLPASS
ncbi:hypothetical protein AGMMS50293_30470 [Spirochaetia bacterium]|nr:hypothetical protein AGMMS50293_30470 [Spirochaetia bacterium]